MPWVNFSAKGISYVLLKPYAPVVRISGPIHLLDLLLLLLLLLLVVVVVVVVVVVFEYRVV
jgi:hypothetical protein